MSDDDRLDQQTEQLADQITALLKGFDPTVKLTALAWVLAEEVRQARTEWDRDALATLLKRIEGAVRHAEQRATEE
jgi:hypothetical protein